MTDFLEMAMADIDDVFFQEFVEQHTIDGETFDVVPYERAQVTLGSRCQAKL